MENSSKTRSGNLALKEALLTSIHLRLVLEPHLVKLQDGRIVALKAHSHWKHRDASCTLSLADVVYKVNAVTQNNEKPSAEFGAYLLQRLLFSYIKANWGNSFPESK